MRTEAAAALLVTLLCAGGAAARAAEAAAQSNAVVLTHASAVSQALERAPQILIAKANLDAAAAAAGQARWPANPEIEIEAENVLGDGLYSDFDSAETTVTLRQPLTLGGKRGARVAAARARLEQAQAEYELAQRVSRREVTIAYSHALLTDRLFVLARTRRVDAELLRAASERQLAAGLISELQYAQAVLAGAEAAATLNRAQADAASARRALARWLGVPDLDGVAAILDETWFDRAAESIGQLSRAAVEQHPRLRAQRAALAAAAAQEQLQQRGAIPDAVISLGARRFADSPAGDNRALVLGISLPLPLWDRNTAERANARREHIIVEIGLDTAQRELADDLALALAARTAASGELRALTETAEPAARSAAALTQRGYDTGRLSLSERLAADRALQSTQETLQRTRFALHQSLAQIEYLVPTNAATAPANQ